MLSLSNFLSVLKVVYKAFNLYRQLGIKTRYPILFFLSIAGSVGFYHNRFQIGRFILEHVFNRVVRRNPRVTLDRRSFREHAEEAKRKGSKPTPLHSHPVSSQIRKIFYTFLRSATSAMSLNIGFLQPGSRDEKMELGDNTITYSNEYHWAVDTMIAPKRYPKTPDLEVIVDTDYYIDMRRYLADPRIVFLYTFQPSQPAGSTAEYTYYFTPENEVHYRLTTGDVFKHRVTNWSSGSLFQATSWRKGTMYYVETVSLSEDRKIIILVPALTFGLLGRTIIALFGSILGFDQEIMDYAPIQSNGQYTYAVIATPENISISSVVHKKALAPNTYTRRQFSDAYNIARRDNATASSLVSIVGSAPKATQLFEYMKAFPVGPEKPMFGDVTVGTSNGSIYTVVTEADTDNEPGTMLPISTPLPPQVPILGEHGALSAISRLEEGRQITADTGKPSIVESYKDYATEFATLLVDLNGGKLTPLSPLEVEEALDLPKHKKQRLNDIPTYTVQTVRANLFPKNESYPKIAAARPIVDFDVQFKHLHSSFTLALAKLLKKTRWYAFGTSPKELVDRIVESVMTWTTLEETDFSKYDSTLALMRELERAMLVVLFHDPKKVLRVWEKQLKLKVTVKDFTTKYGHYTSEGERHSGSPETSGLNSLDNALVSYITFRLMGRRPALAFSSLGFYGGDDGIVGDIDRTILEQVASNIGTKLKCQTRKKGEPFSFLGRYLNAWDGSPYSCYDPVRCLSKIGYHEGKNEVLTPAEILGRKLSALNITDMNTPWVKDMSAKFVAKFGKLPTYDPAWLLNWWSSLATSTSGLPPMAKTAEDWMLDLYLPLVDKAKEEFDLSLSKATTINGELMKDGPVKFDYKSFVPKDSKLHIQRPKPKSMSDYSTNPFPGSYLAAAKVIAAIPLPPPDQEEIQAFAVPQSNEGPQVCKPSSGISAKRL